MTLEYNRAAHQIPVEDPVGVEVMDPVQNLIQQRLDHPSGKLHGFFVGLGGTVELDNMLKERQKDSQDGICSLQQATLCAFGSSDKQVMPLR